MHSTRTIILLLAGFLANTRCMSDANVTHPMYMAYSKLRQDILARAVSVNKIPPSLETNFREKYPLIFGNLIVHIHNFDEIKQVMTLQIFYYMSWQHNGLSWNSSDYNDINTIWIDSSNIWTPTLDINMGSEGSSFMEFNGDLTLRSDGHAIFMKLDFLSFSCSINFEHYPFDSQYCSFGFYPRGPPFAEPIFINNNFSLSDMYIMTKEWSLEKVEQCSLDVHDPFIPEPTQVPTYSLIVRRYSLYYVVSIVFPMVLTSVMIPLVFVIPSQNGEKISYLITLFTSTAIFLNYISDVMPRCLLNMPYLAMLLIEVLVEGLLAMLASLLVVNVYMREKTENRKNKVATVDCNDRKQSQKLITSQTSAVAKINNVHHIPWIFTSKGLDKIFFVAFTIGQIVFLLVLFLGTDWVKGESFNTYNKKGCANSSSSVFVAPKRP